MSYKKINNKLPLAREGIPFILIGIALTSILFILNWKLLAIPIAVATLFSIYFFRDPKRTHVDKERAIFALENFFQLIEIKHLSTTNIIL
ncbi:MAG: hypothetical protein B6I32_02135 [Desulfobacterium sp. 4572_20]|nr:MAG: hypothetical protein B6I32_02135 [Desulfobacterium sp. 4572_20]